MTEQTPDEQAPNTNEAPSGLALMQYPEEFADAEHEGYYWLLLPSSLMHFGGIFGGTGYTPRVLVCKRCGLVVGDIGPHDQFHTGIEMFIKAEEQRETSRD
jgi:hypothetical protein